MGLFIAFIGIACTCLLCSKRFHDYAQDCLTKRKGCEESAKIRPGSSGLSAPLLRLFLQITALLILVVSIWSGTSYVHNNIIPLPMARQILSAFDPDIEVWEENIEKGALGDLGEAHEDWAEAQGHGYDHSRYWQEELWANWRRYVDAVLLIGFFGICAVSWFISHVQRIGRDKQEAGEAKPKDTPQPNRRRVKKVRRNKVRVLGQDSFHKVLEDQNQPKR